MVCRDLYSLAAQRERKRALARDSVTVEYTVQFRLTEKDITQHKQLSKFQDMTTLQQLS